jgi:hypothetical protein
VITIAAASSKIKLSVLVCKLLEFQSCFSLNNGKPTMPFAKLDARGLNKTARRNVVKDLRTL